MKKIALVSMMVVAGVSYAWDSVSEMEKDFCLALTNNDYLLSATFTNQLTCATNLVYADCRCEASMLLSVRAAERFEDTADEFWIWEEMKHASNAVAVIGFQPGKWQYWMARFVYAGAYASQSNYEKSFSVMTNSLAEFSLSGFTNEFSDVGRLLLKKFEMPAVGVVEAMKIMAGMSAAAMGEGNVATNYANQVPGPYRDTILKFVE